MEPTTNTPAQPAEPCMHAHPVDAVVGGKGRFCLDCGAALDTPAPAVRMEPVFRQIASAIDARANCARRIAHTLAWYQRKETGRPQTEETIDGPDGNNLRSWREWEARHAERARELVEAYLPSGSGFDEGTELDLDASTSERLVFHTSFHHMNDCGMYDGWTEHTVTLRASLVHTIALHVGGRNRNDIKDMIHEAFHHALTTAQPVE